MKLDRYIYWVVDLIRLILREVVSEPLYLWEVLLDTSSQINYIFWDILIFDINRNSTILWTGNGIYLGKPYSCRIICIDCLLLAGKKITK